jgi:hypothetical protein
VRQLIGVWCTIVLTASLYTGAVSGRFFNSMTGFLPPHYGYSAYAVVVLLFISNAAWLRWVAGAALLLSGNRASWVGAIAGWAWSQRRRLGPVALSAPVIFGMIAVIGGLAWKPAHIRASTDSVRVQIWKTTWDQALRHPRGVGRGQFMIAVDGNATGYAHSDVLQLLVEQGFVVTGLVLAALLVGFYFLPDGPMKAVVVALSIPSIIDNRLHHPACAALYVAAWLGAVLESRASRPE